MRAAPAFVALPGLAAAVSLADLAPRAMNLPSACEAVYAEQVPGCVANDFITSDCSQACIEGLESLVQPIEQACGNQGVTGENLIVAYLAGVGPQQVCHNAPPGSGSGLPPGETVTSSAQPASTWTSSTSNTLAAAGSTLIGSGTSTAQSATSTPSTLLVDTTSRPAVSRTAGWTQAGETPLITTTTSSTSSHVFGGVRPSITESTSTGTTASNTASSSGNAYTQTHSGEGSPFDAAGSGASSMMPASLLALSAAAGAILFAYVP